MLVLLSNSWKDGGGGRGGDGGAGRGTSSGGCSGGDGTSRHSAPSCSSSRTWSCSSFSWKALLQNRSIVSNLKSLLTQSQTGNVRSGLWRTGAAISSGAKDISEFHTEAAWLMPDWKNEHPGSVSGPVALLARQSRILTWCRQIELWVGNCRSGGKKLIGTREAAFSGSA